MKKLLLVSVFALASIFASAQFTVLTTMSLPDEGEDFEVSSLTENLGVGYQIKEKLMIGAVKNGENYDLYGRYSLKGGMYASLQMPTEEATDNMNIGVGYSLNLYNKLYVEPNYVLPLNEDENGEREGSFKLGLSYKF